MKGAIFSLIIPYFSFNKFSSLSLEIFKFFSFNFLKKSLNFFSSSSSPYSNILFFEILKIFFKFCKKKFKISSSISTSLFSFESSFIKILLISSFF